MVCVSGGRSSKEFAPSKSTGKLELLTGARPGVKTMSKKEFETNTMVCFIVVCSLK